MLAGRKTRCVHARQVRHGYFQGLALRRRGRQHGCLLQRACGNHTTTDGSLDIGAKKANDKWFVGHTYARQNFVRDFTRGWF